MMLFVSIIDEISDETKEVVFAKLRELLETKSYICQVTVNLAFALRVLSHDNSDETDTALINVFYETTSMIIKRDIILILAKHNADYWISNQLMRNPFFLDSESGFDWTLNPVYSGQCFQHFLPAVRVGIGCPVQSIFARIFRIDSFAFMVTV
jgi:hypothetical protein